MIVPEASLEIFRNNPALAKAADDYPIAFFGWHIKYDKQAHIIKDWLIRRPKVCVITGWKRTAKTSLAAYLGSAWLMGQLNKDWPGAKAMGIEQSQVWSRRFRGERVGLIGGSSLDHVETVLLKEYEELIPKGMIKSWFSRAKHHISSHMGSRFVVRSYDQTLEAWKSGDYGFVHLDEEPDEAVLKECFNRTSTTKGQIIISVAIDDADVSYLPEACLNPMKFFGTNSFMHYELGLEDVPLQIVPQESKEIMYKQYDGTPLELAVRKGKFAFLSGRWWPEFDVKVHVIEPFEIPQGWKRWRFIDAGMAAPAACLWATLSPHNDLFFYREYYKKGTTIGVRCREIIELSGNTRIRSQGIWEEVCDNEQYEMTQLDHAEFRKDDHTGDSVDYEYVKEGLQVMPWSTLGQEARRDITRKWLFVDKTRPHYVTKAPGAPRLYIFDTCADLIWEAQRKSFKRQNNPKSGTVEKKVQNKDDHSMDCLESACCELSWIVDGMEIG